ncbi:MAG: tetratricopeptide repeat protein [Chloroflexota bacterium]
MTTKINVRLLGTNTVSFKDETLPFRTDKVKALFAYLLLHAATPVRRETLATLLWPDSSDDTARKNLRDALFHLRKTLDQHDPALSERCLEADRKTVTLHITDCFVVDTAVLSTPNPTSDLAPLIGGELLAGFHLEDAEPFMEWLLLERSRWHDLSLKLLAQWTDQHLQQNEPERAQPLAQRQLALEPWREAAHRQAMRAYGLAQDWAGVAQQYKQCCEVLQTELGVEPSTRTQTLYQDLRKQQQALLAPQHNLPPNLSPFVGRHRELVAVNAAIEQRDYRLFTLTGIGGSGKTRLALAVGQQQLGHFPDGVWFVSLASADRVEDVLPAIASAMGLTLAPEIPLAEQLYSELAEKSVLLILDNLEQLPEEVADVVLALLQQTKALVILTTTRSRLNLRAENLFPIEGLAFPDEETTADFEQFEAVRLFSEQAARVRFEPLGGETYGMVGEICRLLVGSPLAIELAAAQTQEFSVAAIAETLRQSLAVLATTMRDVPLRHRSMKAVFDYSWRLLSGGQQQGLARLALFRQPFLAEAAQAVAAISRRDLAVLVRSSWLKVGENGRYFFHELLREFGLEHLHQQAKWLEATQQSYVNYHLRFLRDQADAFERDVSGQLAARFRQSRADLTAAWELGLEIRAFAELGESIEALRTFYYEVGLMVEGLAFFERIVARLKHILSQSEISPLAQTLQVKVLIEQIGLRAETIVDAALFDSIEEVLTQVRQLNDPKLLLAVRITQIGALRRLGKLDEAGELMEETAVLAQTVGTRLQQASLTQFHAHFHDARGNVVLAERWYRKTLALVDEKTHPFHVAKVKHNLATTLISIGRLDDALPLLETNLRLWQQSGWQFGESVTQESLGEALLQQGQYDLARVHLESSLQGYEANYDLEGMANTHELLGHVALALGDLVLAEQHYQATLKVCRQKGDGDNLNQGWTGLAEVALLRGEIDKAAQFVDNIMPDLLNGNLIGADIFRTCWVCYRVLAKVDVTEADVVLALAFTKLHEQAKHLDAKAQQLFFEGVELHKALIAAAQERLP